MLSTALWVLEQEAKFVDKHFQYTDPDTKHISGAEGLGFTTLLAAAGFQTAAISSVPYYQLYKAHSAASWAVADVAAARAGTTRSVFNYAPRALAFARRGRGSLLLMRAGARGIPFLGAAILTTDLWFASWRVGKWIGEKTSPW